MAARVVGACVAMVLLYVAGFVIGDRHEGLAFLTVIVASPSAYFMLVKVAEIAEQRMLARRGAAPSDRQQANDLDGDSGASASDPIT